jgi:hypothetical protein
MTAKCTSYEGTIILQYEVTQEISFLGVATTERTSRGIIGSKVILALSFVLPYLVDWVSAEDYYQLAIYLPTWVVLDSEWSSYIGPTPMALLMFSYWLPYVYVGYQSYKFANGKYTSVGRYVAGVAFVTLLGILPVIPMTMYPRASIGGRAYYSTVIPLPLISILAMVLIPLLRPVVVISPWDQVSPYDQNRQNSS